MSNVQRSYTSPVEKKEIIMSRKAKKEIERGNGEKKCSLLKDFVVCFYLTGLHNLSCSWRYLKVSSLKRVYSVCRISVVKKYLK